MLTQTAILGLVCCCTTALADVHRQYSQSGSATGSSAFVSVWSGVRGVDTVKGRPDDRASASAINRRPSTASRARTYHTRSRSSRMIRMAADYYDTLGVGRSASKDELKAAFRKLARKYHPDVNDTEEGKAKFNEINQAYQVLNDDEMRSRYDQFGEAGVRMGGGGGAAYEQVDLSDIFESVFGGGMGGGFRSQQTRRGPMRGDDLRVDLELDFKTACFGGEEKVRIRHLENCDTCGGTGVKPGAKSRVCEQCGGSGVVIQTTRTPLGAFQTQTTCPTCRGTGEVVDEYCGTCGGQGLLEKTKQVKVKVPAGVEDGNKLRVKGEGDAGAKGGPTGDLYVFLGVKSHPVFKRSGKDIYSEKTISYLDAILGNENVGVEVVDGNVEIKVPSGCQPETVLRIRGKGAPALNNPTMRGDHYVTVKVAIPRDISAEERDLLLMLQAKNGGGDKDKKDAKKSKGGKGGKGFGSIFS